MTIRKSTYKLPKRTPSQLHSVKAQRGKQRGRRNRQKLPFGFWLAVAILACAIFFFAIHLISDSDNEQPTVEIENTHEAFIATLVPYAQKLQQETGLLPSILLAQAILESDWGRSELGKKYYNLFGRKAFGSEDKVRLKTMEFENDQWIEIEADFKVYPDWDAAMRDHAQLFVNGVTWNTELYKPVLNASNYQEAAQALQDAGYATDPTYAQKIIEVIEINQLAQYD